jgi:hypothetical protein
MGQNLLSTQHRSKSGLRSGDGLMLGVLEGWLLGMLDG